MATGPGALVLNVSVKGESLTPMTASQWVRSFWSVLKSGFDLKLDISGNSPFQFSDCVSDARERFLTVLRQFILS